MILIASQAGANLLLQGLNLVSNSGSFFSSLWDLFLQGDLYKIVSTTAATFALVPICLFIYNALRNKNAKDLDERFFTGDALSFLFLGVIIFGLFFSQATGKWLYGIHDTLQKTGNQLVATATQLANDPATQMSNTISGHASFTAAIQVCERIPDPVKKQQCIDEAYAQANAFANSVANSMNSPGELFAMLGEGIFLTTFTPFFLALGTAFVILLDLGQLLCCLMFPFVLLIGIAQPSYVMEWLKKFWSWGLIQIAYKLIIISVAYALIKLGINGNTLLYAIIAGFGAPVLAFQIISGNSLGLVSGLGSAVAALGRLR